MRDYQHWIGGAATEGRSAERVTRSSPAHGGLLASYAAGTAGDVDAAARAAAAAQPLWASMTGIERANRITALADLMLRDRERLAVIEAEESGKTIRDARGELSHAANLARYAAALAWEIPGRAQSHHGDSALGLVTYEPRGVVGMITPWNFPAVTLFQKLPYALAAGNAVVIKPSELTSGTTLEIARLAAEAGIPDGVINVVTGKGTVVGTAMIEHPLVDMISFTGSTRAGTEIGAACARLVKRAGLELGGKAANVVFADADFDDALDGVLLGTILNAGQECVAGTRILVERKIARDFTEALVERAKKLRVGLPLDESADLASLIHEGHMHSVLGHIERARREGATVAGSGYPDLCYAHFVTAVAGSSHRIAAIHGSSSYNADDYGIALAEHHGAGLTREAFEHEFGRAEDASPEVQAAQVAAGTFTPSPMWNANGWLCARLGLTVTRQVQRSLPVIHDAPVWSRTLGREIAAGHVLGMTTQCLTETAEGTRIVTEGIGKVYLPGEADTNIWRLEGEPDTRFLIDRPVNQPMICATPVNRIPDVIAAAPGLVTTDRMGPPRWHPRGLWIG